MTSIRLSKKSKTIKIVNRTDTLRLQRPDKTIHVVAQRPSLRLQHTGRKGPKGDKGDTGVSTFVRVHHGSNANTPRPDATFVEWVGSVEPLYGTAEDTWVDTA